MCGETETKWKEQKTFCYDMIYLLTAIG